MGKFILNVFALSPFGKKIFRFTAEKIVEAAPSRCRHFMLSGAVPAKHAGNGSEENPIVFQKGRISWKTNRKERMLDPEGQFLNHLMGVLIIYTGILLYPRFSEYELSVLLSVLKQGQKPTVYIGLNDQVVKGESGLPCVPEATVNEVDIRQLDSLVLPGVDDFAHLVDHPDLTGFLRKFRKKDIVIGAISSAPYLLSMSGLLDGRKYTTGLTADQRKFLGTFNGAHYLDSPVVIDGNLITAKGPAFIDFAIKFGEMLNLNFDKRWYIKE